MTFHSLKRALRASIPHRMRRLYDRGGPSVRDSENACRLILHLHQTEALNEFFRPDFRIGRTPQLFNDLADALAALSWQPDGVTFYGDTWNIRQTPLPESD